MTTIKQTHEAVNTVSTANGKMRAICEYCGRQSRPVEPSRGQPSLWSLASGWSVAPYPVDFVHSDGSTGSMYSCPPCGARSDRGDRLYPRREPRLNP